MHEGELFGEMACMTRMPRAATVRADRDLYLLEMLGNVLDMIRKRRRLSRAAPIACIASGP